MNIDEKIKLIKRIQSGDSQAENVLFLEYKNPILWKVTKQIKTDPAEIKDIASEIYIAILEGFRDKYFKPENWPSLDAFIWGVTNNKIRDWFKKKKIMDKYIQPDPPQDEISIVVDNHNIEIDELRSILNKMLNKLSEKYKNVLYLKYFKELSIKEISEQINIPPRRVSERINYALKLMRKECEKSKIFSIYSVIVLFIICIHLYNSTIKLSVKF